MFLEAFEIYKVFLNYEKNCRFASVIFLQSGVKHCWHFGPVFDLSLILKQFYLLPKASPIQKLIALEVFLRCKCYQTLRVSFFNTKKQTIYIITVRCLHEFKLREAKTRNVSKGKCFATSFTLL